MTAARSGLDPEDVRALHPDYEAHIEFSPSAPECMDVVFERRGLSGSALPVRSRPAALGPIETYVNRPHRRAAATSTLEAALRAYARRRLPGFMLPDGFVLLEALPLTPNGKIDRRALPAPGAVRAAPRTVEPPASDLERRIVSVFQGLVGGQAIGVDDNFFDAGANSLLMVQASVRLRSQLGRDVPLVLMFQHPTARALATALSPSTTVAVADAAGVAESRERAEMRRASTLRRRGSAR
jgi:hypothetical protein